MRGERNKRSRPDTRSALQKVFHSVPSRPLAVAALVPLLAGTGLILASRKRRRSR